MATITVTTLDDGVAGSLRDAISLANPAGGDTIDFAPNLAGGTLVLTGGELAITQSLTIDGDIDHNGTPDITISGNYASRVFEVTGGPAIVATLDGLIIQDGSAGLGNSGGGIEVGSTDGVFLNNSRVVNNHASDGGGIHGDVAAEIVLTNSSVCGNSSDGSGGGIYAGTAGTLTLVNTTISDNDSQSDGGGISVGYAASTQLTNATLTGNNSGDHGGAIFGDGAQIRLYDSTLTGNYAGTAGGGIYDAHHVGGGPLVLLSNSIVAGNAAAASAADLDAGGSQLFIHGHNIFGSAPANAAVQSFGTYSTIDGTDQGALETVFAHVGYDPHTGVLAGVLADNGGLVETVAINPTGIAHDTGDNAALRPDFFDLNHNNNTAEPLPVDARDFARVSDASVDVGAFEQQAPAHFIVTTLADETYDGGTLAQEMADGGGLSLREALGLANQEPTTADTITFAPGLTGGNTPGVDDGVLVLASGRLTINGNVTIEGDVNGDSAPDITIDAHGASRDLVIKGETVSLDGLTITGGYAHRDGGGVSIRSGSYGPSYVTISHSVITNNQAGYGGGISVDSDDALLLQNSVVSGNYAYYTGGGIANTGALAVRDTTVSGNSAYYSGGGIANQGALVVVNSTLANNQVTSSTGSYLYASGGGGLYNEGLAALTNTTISGNKGGYAGGGIYNGGLLLLTNVTIANNSAYNGGGLYNAACGCGDATVFDSTITGNNADQFGGGIGNANGYITLTNTIVAGNRAGYQGSDIANGYGITNYSGVNLFSQTGTGRAGTDIVQPDLTQVFAHLTTIDPDGVPNSGDEFLAGRLANNGGPVQTVAIKPGGSAHDTGSTADLPPDIFDLNNNADVGEPLPVDARGAARVFGAAVDIGAVEIQGLELDTNGGSLFYAGNQAASPVDSVLTVSDVNSPSLIGATVAITGNFHAGEDVLGFTDQNGITGHYDSAAGVLTLTGSATLADYQAALQSVTYFNNDSIPTAQTRTVSWQVDDGSAQNNLSLIQTSTISVAAVSISGLTGGNAVENTPVTATIDDSGTIINAATYTWKSNGTTVQSGSSNTYTPTENDEGLPLTVDVSFTDPNDVNVTDHALQLAGTVQEDPNENASISISGLTAGNAVEGTQLTATVTEADAPASGITYTWKVNGAPVFSGVDAAGKSFTPAEQFEGQALSVSVSFTDTHGFAEAGSASAGTVQENPNENASISISGLTAGNAVEGTQLTATVTDADAPASGITYTWKVNGSLVKTGVDAAGNTYTPTDNDEGSPISVSVSFTDTHGFAEAGSASAGTVQENPNENASIVFSGLVNGHPQEGALLTAVVNESDAPASGIAYTWTVNGVVVETGVDGAGNTYKPTQADDGKTIAVSVTFTDTHGFAEHGAATAGTVGATVHLGAGDFDSDGDVNGDLLWQNADGTVVTWDMNGALIESQTTLGQLPSNWHFAGAGQFAQGLGAMSGNSEAFFQSEAGAVLLWQIVNNQVTVNQVIGQVPSNWHIFGVGDVNGDGKSDVLLRSDAGAILEWQVNGTNVTVNQVIGQAPAGGHAVAVADFNHDGNADVLFQTDSGDIDVWLLNGTQIVGSATVGHIPSNWHFVATGDFNGDGRADVLLRSDSGGIVMWEMNGAQVIANQLVGTVPANWTVSGTADVNQDGKSDVIFTSDAGAHQLWEINGTQVIADLSVGSNGTPASPPVHSLPADSVASNTFTADSVASMSSPSSPPPPAATLAGESMDTGGWHSAPDTVAGLAGAAATSVGAASLGGVGGAGASVSTSMPDAHVGGFLGTAGSTAALSGLVQDQHFLV